MVSQKITLHLETGIHARPASALVAFTKQFKSKITLKDGVKEANCASIISIMALGAKGGTELEVLVDGEDENDVLPKVIEFIDNLED